MRSFEDFDGVIDRMFEGFYDNYKANFIAKSVFPVETCVSYKLINPDEIKSLKVIVPGKVVEIVFYDGYKTKMVCHKDDVFNMKRCVYIALAKKLFGDVMTLEGIEAKATELSYYKEYVKIACHGEKLYKNELKKLDKEKELAEMIERKKKRYAEKRKKRLEKKKKDETGQLQKEREEMVNIIADAIKVANNTKN